MEEYINLKAEDVIGKTVLEFFPETRRIWFEKTEPVVYDQQVVNFELKHNSLGKSFFCSAFALKKNRVAVISYDITEKELLREQLMKSEEKYRSLFHENSSMQVVVNADDGKLTDINQAAIEFYGYSREEFMHLTIFDITTTKRKVTKKILKLIAEGKEKHFDSQHRLANGELRDVELYSDNISIEDEISLHFIIHDVSESRRHALESKKFSMGIEQSPALVTITDLKGDIEYVNPRVLELTGYTKNELLGENPRIFKSGNISRSEYKKNVAEPVNGQKVDWRIL
jgi:PAS domain S-box-containing protein